MTKTRTILLVLAALFLMSTPVSAQSTWLPTFSTSQKVYVAPGVDNGVASQFQSADFKAELDKVAAAQKLDVYVIVTKTGSDVSADNSAGPPLVRKVWDNWTSASGFPRQRALVILMTGDGRSFQSVGVRAGESLNRLGIVRDTMSSDTGPVRPVLRANLASNPAVVPIRIAENINGIVAAKQAAQTPSTSGRSSSPTTSNPTTTTSSGGSALGIVLFALGVGFCIFIVGYAITRSNARNYDRHVGSPYTRTTSSGFQQRVNASRRDRTTTTGADTDDGRRNDNDGNNAANTALAAGAGAVGGYILADQVHKRDLRKKDDSGSGTTDSGSSYVAPSCSTPSTPSAPSCSSPSCSSGSSCGGGGGCGGGGCGGG